MAGVFDDSPWRSVIPIIDYADRAVHGNFGLLLTFAFVLVYYALLGGGLDLLLQTFFVGLQYHHTLREIVLSFGHDLYNIFISATGAVVIAVFAISHFFRPGGTLKGPARPFLLPCKTTHARLFPKKHSFEYSYLVVGVPVGSKGNFNGMLTIDDRSKSVWGFMCRLFRGGWYTVNASDYLQRGMSSDGLRGKLDEYLQSQGAEPSDFPHAYLVTAARFLGYHFNPVSFWYLYSKDKILSAIVLEVNNTFDERRPYLVLRDFSSDSKNLLGSESHACSPSRVKGSWPKDFHVSPFNSRKGAYSLLANDPLGPGMEGFRGIDVTINLSSSKGHAKLVARLFSQGEAVDPDSMTSLCKARFLFRWFWVGFATFPRIVREAASLFFKRKLHVWYRPEPLKESLGRHATKTERDLEVVFRHYLKFLVEKSQKPIKVRYVSSGILEQPEEIFASPSWHESSEDGNTIELKVLTPIFYSRFVHYAHDFEAIFTEFTDSATMWVSKPQLLPDLFLKQGSPPLQSTNLTDYLFFKSIQNLRRRPGKIPRVSTSADAPEDGPTTVDIRDFRISSMDAYVLEYADQNLKATYRSTLLRMFVADTWVLGSVALVDFGVLLLRAFFAWVSVTMLKRAANYMAMYVVH